MAGISDYGMIVGTKPAVERIVSEYGGTNFFDKTRDQIDLQESEALSSLGLQATQGLSALKTGYEKQALSDYSQMLGNQAAIRGSNVFSGYKKDMLKANAESYDTALANAYNTYLQNKQKMTSEYTEQASDISTAYEKMRQQVNTAEQDTIDITKRYFDTLPDFLSGIQEYYDTLSDEEKLERLRDYGYNEVKDVPANILEALYNNPVYGQYITRSGNDESGYSYDWRNIAELAEELNDDERTNMYRNLFNFKLGGYTHSNWLAQYDNELLKDLEKEGYGGIAHTKDIIAYGYGGETPQSAEEATKTGARLKIKELQQKIENLKTEIRKKDDEAKRAISFRGTETNYRKAKIVGEQTKLKAQIKEIEAQIEELEKLRNS